jgi:hypothetical protein
MKTRRCLDKSLTTILALGMLTVLSPLLLAAAPAPPPVESPPSVPQAAQPVPKPPTVVREFDSAKFHIRVDRQAQRLHVESPKPQAWLEPTVMANQTVEVIRDAALQRGRERVVTLAKGRKLFVTKTEGTWASTTVMHNGQQESGWIQVASLKPLPGEPRAYKHVQNAGGSFLSAAMLIQKAKQFDDGLYAAADLAAQNGQGDMPAKSQLLRELPAMVDPAAGGKGLTVLLAAGQLGGSGGEVPAAQKKAVAELLAAFKGDEKRSKPLGFYTWSKALEAIFQQDRMLQTPLENQADVQAIAESLQADPALLAAYQKQLQLAYRLTNPPIGGGTSDLSPLLTGMPAIKPADVREWRILPPSLSHESQLFLRLFSNPQRVPDDFDLMKLLVAEIKAGEIDLQPTPESGWYDHQTWALQPLLLPQKMPEASHVSFGEHYLKHLEELFKGTLALTRETHVKQLDFPAPASEAPGVEVEKKIDLVITPDLIIEPLPQMYLRRAQSYLFIREVLAQAFGEAALAEMHRMAQEGPVKATLDQELQQMATIFYGAHVAASRQLGKAEEPVPAGIAADPAAAATALLTWHQSSAADPDLGRDARMMVPVFLDPENDRIKVWCMLGWQTQDAYVSYAKHPAVSATNEAGEAVDLAAKFDVHYYGQGLNLACPIFAEVWVTKLQSRDEFRRHCDTYVTPTAITANLQ